MECIIEMFGVMEIMDGINILNGVKLILAIHYVIDRTQA